MTKDERDQIRALRERKHAKASLTIKATSLLLADEGPDGPGISDAEICRTTGISPSILKRLRKRCCETGSLVALKRKPRSNAGSRVKVTCDVAARIAMLASTQPPDGHARWTLRLLATHLQDLGIIDRISHQSVATALRMPPPP